LRAALLFYKRHASKPTCLNGTLLPSTISPLVYAIRDNRTRLLSFEFCRDRAVAKAVKRKRPVGREPDGSFAPPALRAKLLSQRSAQLAEHPTWNVQTERLRYKTKYQRCGFSSNDRSPLLQTFPRNPQPVPVPWKQLKRGCADQAFAGTVDAPSNRPNLRLRNE